MCVCIVHICPAVSYECLCSVCVHTQTSSTPTTHASLCPLLSPLSPPLSTVAPPEGSWLLVGKNRVSLESIMSTGIQLAETSEARKLSVTGLIPLSTVSLNIYIHVCYVAAECVHM